MSNTENTTNATDATLSEKPEPKIADAMISARTHPDHSRYLVDKAVALDNVIAPAIAPAIVGYFAIARAGATMVEQSNARLAKELDDEVNHRIGKAIVAMCMIDRDHDYNNGPLQKLDDKQHGDDRETNDARTLFIDRNTRYILGDGHDSKTAIGIARSVLEEFRKEGVV